MSCPRTCQTYRKVCLQAGRTWKKEVDFYAVAATIHCLLHNEYMEIEEDAPNRMRPKLPLRRYWQVSSLVVCHGYHGHHLDRLQKDCLSVGEGATHSMGPRCLLGDVDRRASRFGLWTWQHFDRLDNETARGTATTGGSNLCESQRQEVCVHALGSHCLVPEVALCVLYVGYHGCPCRVKERETQIWQMALGEEVKGTFPADPRPSHTSCGVG